MSTTRRVRQTQSERRAHTRAALIAAALDCLAEEGYAATTTRRVAERAHSSLGAIAHHFPTRMDLITATLDETGQRSVAEFDTHLDTLRRTGNLTTAAILDVIWASFHNRLFTVWLRVWTAAGEDRDLYNRLIAVEQRLSKAIADLVAEAAPADLPHSEWNRRLTLALDTIRGLALRLSLTPRNPNEPVADPWPATRTELITLIDRR
ncbi:TetR/AcrR family transcriptional regulator [Nocardia nepalensis]|uniref:TetR/AcrR family transcriptional regulator n=1 Tax=Nocardia nepalensis TaxID=3375448 RepID=UPI003B6749AC